MLHCYPTRTRTQTSYSGPINDPYQYQRRGLAFCVHVCVTISLQLHIRTCFCLATAGTIGSVTNGLSYPAASLSRVTCRPAKSNEHAACPT